MNWRIGLLVVFTAVVGGFLLAGGKVGIILKPGEWFIIVGTTVGNFLISNPRNLQKAVIKQLPKLKKGAPYTKTEYLDLLKFLFNFFKYKHRVSLAELENQIENPYDSQIFKDTPILLHHPEVLAFFCDLVRIVTLGFEDVQALDNTAEYALNEKRHLSHSIAMSVQKLGDALPGIGIVAAVLGVIVAMSSIGSEPAILGARVASALTGTFAGVFLSYGIVTPIGSFLEKFGEQELSFLECMRTALIGYLNGYHPSIAVEFGRQMIPTNLQPTFYELENAIGEGAASINNEQQNDAIGR